ncbi:hypothetical protein ACFLY9_02790 [Patescibacteria group bacterium]
MSEEASSYEAYMGLIDLLTEFGWPTWPPNAGEVPDSSGWWLDEVRVKSERGIIPNVYMISLDGCPKSGKSVVTSLLVDKLTAAIGSSGWRVVLVEDPPIVKFHDDFVYFTFQGGWAGTNAAISLELDWMSALYLQEYKYRWWSSHIQEILIPGRVNEKQIIIGNRGVLDGLVFSYAITSHIGSSRFEIPLDYRAFSSNVMIPTLAGLQALVKYFNAIVFLGIPYEEAVKRRKEEGKKLAGWVTSCPEFYRDLSTWYGYVASTVLPKYHDIHGTGYMVLDGMNSAEHNSWMLYEYILELITL